MTVLISPLLFIGQRFSASHLRQRKGRHCCLVRHLEYENSTRTAKTRENNMREFLNGKCDRTTPTRRCLLLRAEDTDTCACLSLYKTNLISIAIENCQNTHFHAQIGFIYPVLLKDDTIWDLSMAFQMKRKVQQQYYSSIKPPEIGQQLTRQK